MPLFGGSRVRRAKQQELETRLGELQLESRQVEERTEDAHARSEAALRQRCEVAGHLETSSLARARVEAAAHKAETVASLWEEEAAEEAGRLSAARAERNELVWACTAAAVEGQDLSTKHCLEPYQPRLLLELWEAIPESDRCAEAETGSGRFLGEQWLPQDLGREHELQLHLLPRVLLSRPAEGKPGGDALAGLTSDLQLQLSVRSLPMSEEGSGHTRLTVSGVRLVCEASVSGKPKEAVLYIWRWGRGGDGLPPPAAEEPVTAQQRCETSGESADSHLSESDSEEETGEPCSTCACQGRDFGLTGCTGVGGDLLYSVTPTSDSEAATAEAKVCCAACCLSLCAERPDIKLSPLPGRALCSSWALLHSSQPAPTQVRERAAARGPAAPTECWEAIFPEISLPLPALMSTSDLVAATSLRAAAVRQATVDLARHWLSEELSMRAAREEALANEVKALEEQEEEVGFKREIRQAAEVGALVGAVSTLRRESGELRMRVEAAASRRVRDGTTGDDTEHVTIRHVPQVLEPPAGPAEAVENHQRLLRLLRGGGTEGYYSLLYRDSRVALSVSVQRPAAVAAATLSSTSKPRRPTAAAGLCGRVDLRLEVRQPVQHQLGDGQIDFASVRLDCVDVDVAALHLETLPVSSADLPSPVFRQSLQFELLEIHCGPPALSIEAALAPGDASFDAETYHCKTLLPLGVACFLRPPAGATSFGELWEALRPTAASPATDLAAPGRDSPALLFSQNPEFCAALCLGGALRLYSNLGGGGVGFAGELPPHGCVGETHQVLVRAAPLPAADPPIWRLTGRSAEPRLVAAVVAAVATQMKGWSWAPAGTDPEGPLL